MFAHIHVSRSPNCASNNLIGDTSRRASPDARHPPACTVWLSFGVPYFTALCGGPKPDYRVHDYRLRSRSIDFDLPIRLWRPNIDTLRFIIWLNMDSRELSTLPLVRMTHLAPSACSIWPHGRYWCHVIHRHSLSDDAKCFETVRTLRWPEGVSCPHCGSLNITKQGRDDTQPERQRYLCQSCE